MKEYYVVVDFTRWTDLQPDTRIMQWPVSFAPSLGTGFLPVFESLEEASATYPGKQILTMQSKQEVKA